MRASCRLSCVVMALMSSAVASSTRKVSGYPARVKLKDIRGTVKAKLMANTLNTAAATP